MCKYLKTWILSDNHQIKIAVVAKGIPVLEKMMENQLSVFTFANTFLLNLWVTVAIWVIEY